MPALAKKYYLVLFASIFIATACVAFLVRGYSSDYAYLGGDEPNYVMMAESFIADGDFNLKNDYELDRPAKYYPERLFPQLAPIIDHKSTDNWQSIHTIGLPLVLSVPLRVGGVQAVRLCMIALQLSTVILFYFVLKKCVRSDIRIAIGLTCIFTSSIFWQNIGAIFPDFFVVGASLIGVLIFGDRRVWTNAVFVSVMLLGYVAHTKIVLFMVPLFVMHHVYLVKSTGLNVWLRKFMVYPALAIVLAGVYSAYLYVSYGIVSPAGIYGNQGQLFSTNPLLNLLAIMTDGAKGLLIYMPGLILAVTYGIFGAKALYGYLLRASKNRKITQNLMLATALTVGLLGYMLTQFTFNDWSGSHAPNGRYMLIGVFIGAFWIVRYINLKDTLQIAMLGMALLMNGIMMLPFVLRFHIFMDPGAQTFITRKLALPDLIPIFPLLVAAASRLELQKSILIFCGSILLSLILFIIFTYRNRRIS